MALNQTNKEKAMMKARIEELERVEQDQMKVVERARDVCHSPPLSLFFLTSGRRLSMCTKTKERWKSTW